MSCVNRGVPSTALLPSPWEQLRLWHSCEATPDMRQHCPANLMRAPFFSLFARLIMSHVMNSCVGVKLIPGASGESRVVSGPLPGYPHVWSKQGGQCLPGCVLEQTHATLQRNVMQTSETCQCWDDRTCMLRQRQQFRVLGFITARADNLWACEDWDPPCAAFVGAAVRVFFGCGVDGAFSVAALRALDTVAPTGGPPGACASSKSAISSA